MLKSPSPRGSSPYRLLLGKVTRGAQDDDDGVILEFSRAAVIHGQLRALDH